jgi:tryptophan halogenase
MKIVIVGGGTAGWLAALMIKKVQSNHDVIVVESSKIPIIGAGEGSTGLLTDIICGVSWNYGCNERDFLLETGATIKLGIKHKDWVKVGKTFYGPLDGTDTSGTQYDYFLINALANGEDVTKYSRNGFLIHNNSSGFYDMSNPENTNSPPQCFIKKRTSNEYCTLGMGGHSYHFDAFKVGKYFKKISTQAGVNVIDSEVDGIIKTETGGIKSLKLSSGLFLDGDFFIDCSGFSRVLMKHLGVEWIDYSKNLPVNTALPFLLPFESNEIIEPVTTAWAQSAGWMWKIPVQGRYGCGYVFDDNFITPEQAQKEIEAKLNRAIDPIRVLKFNTGRLKELWKHNCLAVGLAAAFAEPLEATSIHSTIVQLHTFVFNFLRDKNNFNQGVKAQYNKQMAKMYDDFKDFLVLHYQTKRKDSEFWRWIGSGETCTDRVLQIKDLAKHKIPHNTEFDQYYGYAGAPLWNWILIGLGIIDKNLALNEQQFWGGNRENEQVIKTLFENDMRCQVNLMINNNTFVREMQKYLSYGNILPNTDSNRG